MFRVFRHAKYPIKNDVVINDILLLKEKLPIFSKNCMVSFALQFMKRVIATLNKKRNLFENFFGLNHSFMAQS